MKISATDELHMNLSPIKSPASDTERSTDFRTA